MVQLLNTSLAHEYIITELAYRTLLHDEQYIALCKSASVISQLYDELIVTVREALSQVKIKMAKEGLHFIEQYRDGELITIYIFKQYGKSETFRYMNPALRNHTLAKLEELLIKKGKSQE